MKKTPVPQHDLNLNPTDQNVQRLQNKMDVLIATLSELEVIFTRYSEACQPMKELFSASKQYLASLRSGNLSQSITKSPPGYIVPLLPDTEKEQVRSAVEEQSSHYSFRSSSAPPMITASSAQSSFNPSPASSATLFSTETGFTVPRHPQYDDFLFSTKTHSSAPLSYEENHSDNRNGEHDFIQNLLNLQKELDIQSSSRTSFPSQSSLPDVSEPLASATPSSPSFLEKADTFSYSDSDLSRNLFSLWEKLDKLPPNSSEPLEQRKNSETPFPINESSPLSLPVDFQHKEIELVQKSIEKNTRELLHLVEKTNEYLRELLGKQRDEIIVEVE